MAHIRLERVSKRFGAHAAVDDLTLDIADGEFFVLLGPTGAGKTTTLRLIAGIERPNGGAIAIDGQDVGGWSVAERDVALVFQYYSLYPRFSVRQNLEFPLKSRTRRHTRAEIDERIARAAKTLRIEHLLDRKTDKLSGGEMQRVSIGRAIVREPRAFLMDEPLSNLDAKLRELLRAELKDLQMKLGATFLFVTHDQVEAMSMGDRIGVLNRGRLVQVGTPQEIYSRPRDTFVAGFVGSPAMNLFGAEIRDGRAIVVPALCEFALEGRAAKDLSGTNGSATLGIRVEEIRIDDAGPFEGKVHGVENHGVEKIVTLRVGDCLLRSTTAASVALEIEATVRFGWNLDKMHCFDAASGRNLACANA